jgi:fructose-specific component phosphotransferase system IIB-like protein
MSACLIGMANPAIALTETWRLQATVIDTPGRVGPFPDFLQPGDTIEVDYLMDLDARLNGGGGVYGDSILSVTFHGETSPIEELSGYLLAWNRLVALHATFEQARQNDLINAIEFNNSISNADALSGVRSALVSMASGVANNRSTLSVSFGRNTVYATPTSFAPVPEPATATLLLTGALAIGVARSATRRRQVC